MKRLMLALCCLVFLVAAKSEIGRPFNDGNLVRLQIGVTSLEDTVRLLGRAPDSSTVGQSGAIGHTWSHIVGKASMWTGKSSATAKTVTLVFSADGTFQRIYTLQGITLPPAELKRLMTDPAVERAAPNPNS